MLQAGAALFLLFAAYRVLLVYRFDLAPCPPPPAAAVAAPVAAATLRVLSYNIEGHAALVRGGHLAAVAEVIRAAAADVVGLQEVHRGTWQSRFRDQAVELARGTGMTAVFGPSFRVLGGEFGNAVLVRGEVLESDVVALPSFGEPRSLLRARVRARGLETDVFVTHLSAWGSATRPLRVRQVRCLREQLQAAGRPFVLTGDLNAPPQSPEIVALLGADLARLCGEPGDTTHPFLRRRIDYVLAGPGWQVVEAAVIKEGPSDHWPVLAVLSSARAAEAL